MFLLFSCLLLDGAWLVVLMGGCVPWLAGGAWWAGPWDGIKLILKAA
jgi:hypothetical protein